MFTIIPLVLGPVQTNAYLLGDDVTHTAVVVDPAWEGQRIVEQAQQHGWTIVAQWLTHAHFDHIAGAAAIARSMPQPPPTALHPADLPLWQAQGGAPMFGIKIEAGPAPSLMLAHGQVLSLGEYRFEVRHCPGHTPGHVIFYCAQTGVAFCGDVIFACSIGRTDLPGGSHLTLLESIQRQVLSLPDETRLLSGHGPETSVGLERVDNPFLV